MNGTARLLVILLLFFLVVGMLPMWPYSSGWGWGYYPSGGLGLILVIVLVVALLDVSRGGRRPLT